MTLAKLKTLPLGTRVAWSKKGVACGDTGKICSYSCPYSTRGVEKRFIQWDDGGSLLHPDKGSRPLGLAMLRWVKEVKASAI